MPGPFDLLKRAGKFALEPLVPESAIKPAQDMLDSPTLDRTPNEARLRGFGAGALEGMRGFTSPLSLGSLALGMGSGAAAARGAGAAAKAAAPTIDVLESNPVRQVAPMMDDVESLIGDLQRNLAKVPKARPAPMETLGERAAEFTPRGGEGLYNAGKGAGQQMSNGDGLYETLMQRFGFGGR